MERRRLARAVRSGPGIVLAIGLAVVLAACGDDDVTTTTSIVDVPETVAMGVLPPQPVQATLPAPPPPPTTEPISTTSPAPPASEGPIEAPLGELVGGNRILLVGDSILASTAPRNGGQLCDALTLFGWQAEIDAVSDRGIDFAAGVLDARIAPDDDQDVDWDVVALSFGSDVDGTDADAVGEFGSELGELIDRLAPRPVLLYTLVEQGEGRAAINEVIRAQPESRPNVLVIEFADAGADGVAVLDDAGRGLTDDGMKRFSIRTAAAVGDAPGDEEGACLPSQYQD
jgi:hypothetical protein